jgi:putative RecB family exonuclease
MTFTNRHLSFSRVQRYEQCPKSFKLHYVEPAPSEPGVELKFGKAIHWVLEQLVAEHVAGGVAGPLPVDRAIELWQRAWTTEGLVGVGIFQEGMEILKTFVRGEGAVDPAGVLGVEKAFEITIGRFRVVGSMDRVDQIDHETIRVRDYKTNRLIFSRDEVDESLQLSLYMIAAEELWPWAKKIELQFDMLRHELKQRTSRTSDDLDAARRYIGAVGDRTETDTEFKARLNSNCNYCDHRTQCDEYAGALKGKRENLALDLSDLEAVAREREEVARIAKIAYARKAELEEVLKARLETEEKLELGGVRYQVQNACSVEYPLEATLRVLMDATGYARETLVSKLATIDKDALKGLLRHMSERLPRPRVTLVKAELDARASKSFTPRFSAKEVRS